MANKIAGFVVEAGYVALADENLRLTNALLENNIYVHSPNQVESPNC